MNTTSLRKENTGRRKNKAVALDRDGVLNKDEIGYPHKEEHLILAPNAKEGMDVLKSLGVKLVIVTNQSGVGHGYYTEEDFHNFTNVLLEKIGKVDDVFACFHKKHEGCECRKPKPKMLLDAAEKHDIELEDSYFIGDAGRDIEAGKRAGMKTIFIKTNSHGSKGSTGEGADFHARDLLDAALWIKENENKNKG